MSQVAKRFGAATPISLEETPAKLPVDHANARFLAEGLARIPGIQVDPATIATNVVVFDVSETGVPPVEISGRLKQRGVLMNPINERSIRALTHYDVDRAQCAQAVEAVADSLRASVAAGKTS